ncbi:MAG: DUF4421 family protein, partial [Bacteroidales bacterium]|nr:DUF4421 family protein [Bacteroidales bacterium]
MKRLLLITAIILCTSSLYAQEPVFLQKAYEFLIKRDDVDTTRIYQPSKACLSLGLLTTGQKAGFDVDVDFKVKFDDASSLDGISKYSLSENLCKKIGLEVGYGNASFSYSLEVGSRSAWKKSAFGLGIIGKSWGAKFNYSKITNPFISSFTVGQEGNEGYFHDEIITEEAAVLKNFTIDGYYVFNNKRFAYPAAYKIGLIQRHTAGSWMLTARYMQGSLYNTPEASWDSYNMLDCFSTMQASVGGGYSVNFVLWHKDPVGPRDEGLRNLTINLTAMPVITFANYLKTTVYEFDLDEENDEFHHTGERVSKIWCYPMPNYIGSAAVGLTMWRFFFSTQFTYNRFYFRSRDAFNASQMDIPNYVDGLSFRGT